MRSARDDEAEAANASLIDLFLVTLKIGCLSFGGGLTGWAYREFVERRRWLGEDAFLSGVALGQILPGPNVVNLVVYIGQRLAGMAGACVGLVGLIVGPFFITIALVALYDTFKGLAPLRAGLDGIAAAAIGLILVVAAKSARYSARNIATASVLLATVITVGILRWPLVPVVLVVAPISVCLAWLEGRGSHA